MILRVFYVLAPHAESITKKLGINIQCKSFKGELSGMLYLNKNEVIIGVNSEKIMKIRSVLFFLNHGK